VDRVIKVCDLHDGDALATTSLRLVGLGEDRRLDVCDGHLSVLRALQVHVAAGVASPPPARGAAADDHPETPATTSPPARPAMVQRSGMGTGSKSAAKQPRSRRSLQQERAVVREWARQQGRDIGDKGRLPTGLMEEFRRTQGRATG
jgi:Lsr2 protein